MLTVEYHITCDRCKTELPVESYLLSEPKIPIPLPAKVDVLFNAWLCPSCMQDAAKAIPAFFKEH